MDKATIRHLATKELALLSGLLFLGFVIMPIAIYLVGQLVFGEYGGVGYSDFFGNLSRRIRGGDWVAWFLILSPWIGWQLIRVTASAWRASKP